MSYVSNLQRMLYVTSVVFNERVDGPQSIVFDWRVGKPLNVAFTQHEKSI